MSLCRSIPYFKHFCFKSESGSRTTCHSSLESTPCSELPGDSPQSVNTDLLSLTSSMGSITDQLHTESPDQESSLSGENGVLQESNDSDTFSVLEVPGPAPDFLNEEGANGTELSRHNLASDPELHAGVLSSLSQAGEDLEGGDITESEEETCPVDEGLSSRQSLCRQQDSSAEAQEAGVLEPYDPQGTFSEVPLLDSPPLPSSHSWAPSTEGWLLGTRADGGSTEEPDKEQGFPAHMGATGHLSSHPWHTVTNDNIGHKAVVTSGCDLGSVGTQPAPLVSTLAASAHEPCCGQPSGDQVVTSSDEEDIYAHGLPSSSSETSVMELGGSRSLQDLSQPATNDTGLLKSDQVRAFLSQRKSLVNGLFSFLWKEIVFLLQNLQARFSSLGWRVPGTGSQNDLDGYRPVVPFAREVVSPAKRHLPWHLC